MAFQDFESYMNESAPTDFESFMSTQEDNLTPWQKARKLAEQAGATGRAPIPTGPGILGGERPDLAQMGKGLVQGAARFIPETIKMAGDFIKPLASPGASLFEQGMAQAAQEKAKTMGAEPPAPESGGALAPLKTAMGLAEWWPRMMATFIKDPVGTANRDPFSVLVLATGGQAKEIKAWMGRKKSAKLSPADLKAAFNESGSAPKELAGAFDYLDRAEEPGVFGEGGTVVGRNVPEVRRAAPRQEGPTPMPETAEFARPGEIRGLNVKYADNQGRPVDARGNPLGADIEYVPTAKKPRLAMRDRESGKVYAGLPGDIIHADMVGRLEQQGVRAENMTPGFVRPDGSWAANASEAIPRRAGEVRGLGIEFVDNEGRPISRADAFAAKPKAEMPPVEAPKPGVAQAPPNQPPLVTDFFAKIKEAKRLTPKQKNLISIEKKKRLAIALEDAKKLGGRAGYEAQMKALSGAYEKVDFEPLKLTQEHIDSLFQHIEDSPALVGFDKIQAKEGLAKMLGEKGAGIPQPKQLALLKEVFGPEVAEVIGPSPWKDLAVDLLNVPRAVTTSGDMSFGLRQGIFYMARHPAKFWKAFPSQVKWFASDKASKAVFDNVRNRETYPLMREAGLDVIGKEEPFQSGIAEKIPVVGAVVKASSRAYTTFATKLRADAFDNLVNLARKAGRDPFTDIKLAKDMAEQVNTVTGRGNLGRLERISRELNGAFFSPKLMASRLQVLNPKFYIKLDPLVRKEALTNLAAFAGYAATVVGLAKVSGLEVGVNPTSADFGKIKVGNTRIDPFGGFSQYVRLASQLITGKITSTTSGKVIKLNEGYKPTTRLDVMLRFAEAKEAPVFSFATGLFKGQNWIGEKFSVGKEAANRFIPMVIQDFVDIYKDDPSLFPLGFLGVFGAGLQTYQPRPQKRMY